MSLPYRNPAVFREFEKSLLTGSHVPPTPGRRGLGRRRDLRGDGQRAQPWGTQEAERPSRWGRRKQGTVRVHSPAPAGAQDSDSSDSGDSGDSSDDSHAEAAALAMLGLLRRLGIGAGTCLLLARPASARSARAAATGSDPEVLPRNSPGGRKPREPGLCGSGRVSPPAASSADSRMRVGAACLRGLCACAGAAPRHARCSPRR